MQSPRTVVDRFRRAVAAGAFLEAQELIELYRGDVESSWNAATSDEQRRAIALEVSETFEWARTATLAARSHTQRKLILLRRESAYTPSVRQNEVLNLNA